MNLLDYMMMIKEKSECPTKNDVRSTMTYGDDEEKEQLWERVYAAGGYDALEDE